MSRIRKAAVRKAVMERAQGLCEYCRCREDYSPIAFSIEHCLPVAKAGADSLTNLALACQECNNHKFTKTTAADPETETEVPLYNPRQHQWTAHFAWSDNFVLLIGRTPIGRAAIETLHLNRDSVQNLRQLLYAFGKHPPPEPSE